MAEHVEPLSKGHRRGLVRAGVVHEQGPIGGGSRDRARNLSDRLGSLIGGEDNMDRAVAVPVA